MRRRRRVGVMVVAAALAVGLTAGRLSPALAGAPVADKVPDLRMQPLNGARITVEGGHRLLRFGAIMSNWGAGHFEIHATRSSSTAPWTVNQVIYDTSGSTHEVPTPTSMKYAGDGHDHWHVRDMMYYDLWGPGGNYREAKVGFCFLDSTPVALGLPGARQSAYYREQACDGLANTNIRTGISVGWGDNYPWYFAYQWVDITGIAPGIYTLRSIVDPLNNFAESNEDNNCTWLRVSIPSSGNLTVLAKGQTCVDDIAGTPFEGDIDWLYAEGLTSGCRPLLFCTDSTLTRGQMAAFLARALELPATSTDYFDDDDGTLFEGEINRLAAAGITSGCATRAFCPDAPVLRDQMASFLVRAFKLPLTVTDFFDDDEGNLHENQINALANSGITGGCGPDRYCPSNPVTRGQMAAFLHRALG
jgi:hypothetical protein